MSVSLVAAHPTLLPIAEEVCKALGLEAPHLPSAVNEASLFLEAAGDTPLKGNGLEVLAVLRRGDARDGLVVSDDHAAVRGADVLADPHAFDPTDPLRALGEGAVVAAHGALRCSQIAINRPDLDVRIVEEGDREVLRHWEDGTVDAAVIPSALLDLSGFTATVRRRLAPPWITTAAAGGLWLRGEWSAELRELVLPLDDRASRLELIAERAVSDAIETGEGVSLGVEATVSQGRLDLRATLIQGSERRSIAASRQGEATMRGAQRLAAVLVRDLRERGAGATRP